MYSGAIEVWLVMIKWPSEYSTRIIRYNATSIHICISIMTVVQWKDIYRIRRLIGFSADGNMLFHNDRRE